MILKIIPPKYPIYSKFATLIQNQSIAMKILKFGGTSVGSAERMKALVNLISSDEKKIVVLSAMSGTTNKLVDICKALFNKQHQVANDLIDALESSYLNEVEALYATQEFKTKGIDLIKNHFNFHKRIFS